MPLKIPSPPLLVAAAQLRDGDTVSLRARADDPCAFVSHSPALSLKADVGGWLRDIQSEIPELVMFSAEIIAGHEMPEVPFPSASIRSFLANARMNLAEQPGGKHDVFLSVSEIERGVYSIRVVTDEDHGSHPPLTPLVETLFAAIKPWLGEWLCYGVALKFNMPEMSAHERLALSAET